MTATTTVPQLTLFLMWLSSAVVLFIRLLDRNYRSRRAPYRDAEKQRGPFPMAMGPRPEDGINPVGDNLIPLPETSHQAQKKATGVLQKTETSRGGEDSSNGGEPAAHARPEFSQIQLPPSLDEFLKCCLVFGALMMIVYLCDYEHIFPPTKKVHSLDHFMFSALVLFIVAAGLTVRTTQDKILNRDQTEEWRGWMQVMFVWYHYFDAKEAYIYIRVLVASYVWMTGFGNFSFFWLRKDFSIWRLLKMLFRLNFLVVVTMVVSDNAYLFYYICAMHTYWFITVYAVMRVLPSWNDHRLKMAIKLICYFVLNVTLFDTRLHKIVFRPLGFALYVDGSMDKWHNRSVSDHHAAFVGMLCAYNYPYYERFLNYLEKRHLNRSDYLMAVTIKVLVVGILFVCLATWHTHVRWRTMEDYLDRQPFIEWVPVATYVVTRNLFPVLRTHYVGLFAFLGKFTLETYITQFHIYMQHGGNRLIVLVPRYPMVNYAVVSAIFFVLAHRLFLLTTKISAFILPQNTRKVAMNILIGFVVIVLHASVALLCRKMKIF